MVEELAGRGTGRQIVNCQERLSIYNANTITRKMGEKMKVGSIVEEALEHWYAEMLNEAQLVQPITSYQGINLQKSRNAWNYNSSVFFPKGQYTAGFFSSLAFLDFENGGKSTPTSRGMIISSGVMLVVGFIMARSGRNFLLSKAVDRYNDY